jgi:hypothetical protein
MIEEQIVGKWKWHSVSYDFRGDGTYDYRNSETGLQASGRYAITGENTMMFFIKGPSETRFSFTNDSFIQYPEGGGSFAFTRLSNG